MNYRHPPNYITLLVPTSNNYGLHEVASHFLTRWELFVWLLGDPEAFNQNSNGNHARVFVFFSVATPAFHTFSSVASDTSLAIRWQKTACSLPAPFASGHTAPVWRFSQRAPDPRKTSRMNSSRWTRDPSWWRLRWTWPNWVRGMLSYTLRTTKFHASSLTCSSHSTRTVSRKGPARLDVSRSYPELVHRHCRYTNKRITTRRTERTDTVLYQILHASDRSASE